MWLGFFKSHLQDAILSSSSCLDSDITSMSSFVLDQDLTIPAMKGYSISHVYRGLICFSKGPSAQIYNTTTRQMVVLPSIEESKILAEGYTGKTRIMYAIGNDPVHNTYKLVCTVTKRLGDYGVVDLMSEHWVLLLGADVTSGWRKIVHIGSQPNDPYVEGLTICNGRMYYFASGDLSDPDHVLLVSVDIDSEESSILQVPDYWSHSFYNYLIDYGGRVAILDHKDFTGEGVMKLIVLEDEEKNRWSRKNLVLHPSQLEMVNSDDWSVEGTTINGEVILVLMNATRTPGTRDITFKPQATNLFHVLLYNPQKNHIRKVEIREPSSRYHDRVWKIIGFDDVENLIHI